MNAKAKATLINLENIWIQLLVKARQYLERFVTELGGFYQGLRIGLSKD